MRGGEADDAPSHSDQVVDAIHVSCVLDSIRSMVVAVVLDDHPIFAVGEIRDADEPPVPVGHRYIDLGLREAEFDEVESKQRLCR